MTRTLVVAAYPPELEGLTPLLAEPMSRGQIVSRAIGVGLVEAAAGIERALAELQPDRVLLVGTAGSLPSSDLKIGEVAVVRRAHLVVREPEYAPALMRVRAEADPLLSEALAKVLPAPLVEVACPLGITLSDDEAQRLAAQGPARLEHLESFAVLLAAFKRQLPATAVLAVANRVGYMGASEWRKHHVEAEKAAVAAVARAFAS
jgi:nucleoside phosphorylase